MKDQVPDLLGKTFGTWTVLSFEGVIVASERGAKGGKQIGVAKRATWLCKCRFCGHTKQLTTDYLRRTPPTPHRPCQKLYKDERRAELKRDAAALFGGANG